MISNLSESIVKRWQDKNIIDSEDYELYHYGMFIILSDLWLFSFTVMLGAIFKIILPSIVFFAVFFITRRFAGGFHARTELQCQIISLSFLFISIAAMRYLLSNIDWVYLIIIYMVCAILLPIVSPADTPQKPLSDLEIKKFKSIVAFLSIIFLLINIVLFIFKLKMILTAISSAYILETVLVITGKLFNNRI